jgi:hypothetical protein
MRYPSPAVDRSTTRLITPGVQKSPDNRGSPIDVAIMTMTPGGTALNASLAARRNAPLSVARITMKQTLRFAGWHRAMNLSAVGDGANRAGASRHRDALVSIRR